MCALRTAAEVDTTSVVSYRTPKRVLLMTDGRVKDGLGLPLLECPCLLIDIERGPIRLGRARQLAGQLGAEYRHSDDVH